MLNHKNNAMKKKIAIITFHAVSNHGSVLQKNKKNQFTVNGKSKIRVNFAQLRYVSVLHRGKLLSFDPSENLENSCSMGKSLKAVLPIVHIPCCLPSVVAHAYSYRCELIFILHATGIPEPSDSEWQEAHTLCA